MELRFAGEVVRWRGPAPHHVVVLPAPQAARRAEGVELGDDVTLVIVVDDDDPAEDPRVSPPAAPAGTARRRAPPAS